MLILRQPNQLLPSPGQHPSRIQPSRLSPFSTCSGGWFGHRFPPKDTAKCALLYVLPPSFNRCVHLSCRAGRGNREEVARRPSRRGQPRPLTSPAAGRNTATRKRLSSVPVRTGTARSISISTCVVSSLSAQSEVSGSRRLQPAAAPASRC